MQMTPIENQVNKNVFRRLYAQQKTKKDKTKVLNTFCELTGMHRNAKQTSLPAKGAQTEIQLRCTEVTASNLEARRLSLLPSFASRNERMDQELAFTGPGNR